MKILDRYISREFIKAFLFGMVALILVSTVVTLFERVDDIVENSPPFQVTLGYFLARIPQLVIMIAPISILLTTLIVTGSFARNSEIIAMLAGGVSIYRILVPLLVIGFLTSIVMLGLNEFVVPTANRMSEECKRIIKGKPDTSQMAQIHIWYRGKRAEKVQHDDIVIPRENRIYSINALIPEGQKIHGLTVFELNEQFVPVTRVDAASAQYHPPDAPEFEQEYTDQAFGRRVLQFFKTFPEKVIQVFHSADEPDTPPRAIGRWTLIQGSERTLTDAERQAVMTFEERHDYVIPRSFEEFRRDTKDPEDMNYRELVQYIETLTTSGYDVSEYIVDLRAKFSYPFVSFVMVIIGFPFALKSPRSGAAMGVGLSVFIGLTYWIILQLGISLGHADILPPTLAAWISHIIFACAGLYLILSTRT